MGGKRACTHTLPPCPAPWCCLAGLGSGGGPIPCLLRRRAVRRHPQGRGSDKDSASGSLNSQLSKWTSANSSGPRLTSLALMFFTYSNKAFESNRTSEMGERKVHHVNWAMSLHNAPWPSRARGGLGVQMLRHERTEHVCWRRTSGGPVVKTAPFNAKGPGSSLVGELRSHRSHSQKTKTGNRSNIVTDSVQA